jgi:hypothetical protein
MSKEEILKKIIEEKVRDKKDWNGTYRNGYHEALSYVLDLFDKTGVNR